MWCDTLLPVCRRSHPCVVILTCVWVSTLVYPLCAEVYENAPYPWNPPLRMNRYKPRVPVHSSLICPSSVLFDQEEGKNAGVKSSF